MLVSKRVLFLFVLCVFVTGGALAQCDPTLWRHVYSSSRLTVNKECMSISGKVYSLIYEDDGDIHIRVTLDSPFTYMLNSVNYSSQYGRLVCEPLCATTCVQASAMAACAGFTNTVYIPAVGEHVVVTGSYVTDDFHGWNEIHPVTSIVLGYITGVNDPTQANKFDVNVYPNPADSKVNFKLSEKPGTTVFISIADEIGRNAGQYQMQQTQQLEINTQYLHTGTYFYDVTQDGHVLKTGKFVVAR